MPGKAFIPRADTAKKVTIMLKLLKVTNCNGELMIPIKETKESIPIARRRREKFEIQELKRQFLVLKT